MVVEAHSAICASPPESSMRDGDHPPLSRKMGERIPSLNTLYTYTHLNLKRKTPMSKEASWFGMLKLREPGLSFRL